ncbi:nucleotide-binding universal stress UspA family protein [Rhizobium binae]|uniref:Nucleotide-binding universal stress UspA family protein n=1 Tax=Rhizobium binae TaxID=1138190 RepID=A0ABV2MGZ8_9HYPH|nr:universal stress protein [Rhizobium binae]MBX4995101.1 universal stress protein [Rhizobium binae]NKL50194.1 universal stress protein [Rhizobium leguminosarum bv. viciae]QSY85179.1 universal stress protein [Rhizobium binae]
MYKHLLIPTDGSALSTAALEKSIRFASEIGAKATVLTVTQPFKVLSLTPDQLEFSHEEYDRYAGQVADEILEQARNVAAQAEVVCYATREIDIDPSVSIVRKAAESNCDLIAMGSHGREGFKAFMLGSVTMKVLANSRVPVLVYR